jgi:hypothetical protein
MKSALKIWQHQEATKTNIYQLVIGNFFIKSTPGAGDLFDKFETNYWI